MAEIGELSVRLDANTRGLERGARRGRQELQDLGSGMERTVGIARRLTGVLAAIGVGVGFSQAIREIANFQTAMNGLAAVSNATERQMGQLENQARTLGATSRFSAQQAAEGQRFLAQAGFEVNEVLGATPGILQLATAAELDLGTAADIASNVLGGMRLEVEELNRVNDVLAATASRSNTTIQQLGQALSFAAPFAAGAGVSIEEAAAAIGNMSDAGIQASRAGTGLVGVIRQLSNVTGTGEDVLSKYGLSVADVNIEARGLQPVLETLRETNLSTADAIALFGSEAGAAAQVLVNDYNGAIEDATGEAERMASQLDQGLGPAFRSLQSAISESVLQMGNSGLAGALENAIRLATGVVSSFNGMTEEWGEANDASESLKNTVDALAAAIQTLSAVALGRGIQALASYTAAKVAATGATLTFSGAVATLRSSLLTLMGPAGIVLGGITALGALGRHFDQTSEKMARMEGRANELAASLQHMGETSIRTQLAAVTLELAQMDGAQQALEEQSRRSSRTNSVLAADFENLGDTIQTTVLAARHSGEEHEKLRTQQMALKEALDLVSGSAREASRSVEEIGPVGGAGDEDDAGDTDDEDAPRFAGGIGIFGEDENQAFIERLRAQLEMRDSILREFDALDVERQEEKFESDMERLREALELRAITEQEFRDAQLEAERDYWSQRFGITQDAESGLTALVESFNDRRVDSYATAFDSILNSLSQHSKAAFNIQKGLAIASATLDAYEAITGAYKVGARIGGPPLGAAFAAAAGAAQFATIANIASQQYNASSSSLGGGGGVAAGGGGGSTGSSAQPAQQQRETLVANLSVQGQVFDRKTVIDLVEQINDLQDEGMRVRVVQ